MAFSFVAGNLALDFCNTASNWNGEHQSEKLAEGYLSLLEWGRQAGLLSADRANQLASQAKRQPASSQQAIEEALSLRDLLYRIFSRRANKVPIDIKDLTNLSRLAATALMHHRLEPEGNGFHWVGQSSEDDLKQVVWPIVVQAVELLNSPQLPFVGQCDGDSCGWLFLDTSKNHSRRWCAMGDCGNRVKAKRFYQKERQRKSTAI